MIRADYRDMNDDEKVIAKSYRQTYRAPRGACSCRGALAREREAGGIFWFACPRSDKDADFDRPDQAASFLALPRFDFARLS